MKGIVFLFLGFLGMFVIFLFGVYFISLIVFVFDETIDYPGAISSVPDWVFFFSSLVFFLNTKEAKNLSEKLVDRFF